MVQYRFSVELLIEVPPTAFNPAPKVDSAVVRLIPLQPLPYVACNEKIFAQVVTMAFSQRRKTLRNSLSACLSGDDLARIGITPTARAQELTVAQFVAIADYVAQAGRTSATSCPSE
jgi:16S rRNA (adenine1518-N6/adenine1519-N6)-dimethyltransferase